MSIEDVPTSHTWVSRPTRVTIEYTDGRTPLTKEMSALDAKSLSDITWVDKRLGQSAVAAIFVEFLDHSDS